MHQCRLPDPRGLYAGLAAFLIICVNAGCATISCSPLATHIAHHPELCANVSVILVDATPDLGNWGRLPELTSYFQCSGVEAFYFHPNIHGDEQCLASWIYHEKVQRGRQVILVGWSYGMVDSLDALKVLEKQSVRVDTLISIDCFCLNFHRGSHLQPSNADRVVLVYRESAALPEGFHHPAVYRVATCNHLKMPGHPVTVSTLFRETLRLGQIQAYGTAAPPPVRIPVNGLVCSNGEPQGGCAVQQVLPPLQRR